MTVSERIFYLLDKQCGRQNDLVKLLKVRATTVSEWKSGRREPSAAHYIKLADYFGVSLDYLIAGKEARAAPVQQIIGNSNSNNVVTIAGDGTVNVTEWERELLKVCGTFDIRRKTALLTYAYDLEKEIKNNKE